MFWNYAKSRLKTRDNISSLTKADGTTATTATEKAEALNNFFASVFTLEDLQTIPDAPKYNYVGHVLAGCFWTSLKCSQYLQPIPKSTVLVPI